MARVRVVIGKEVKEPTLTNLYSLSLNYEGGEEEILSHLFTESVNDITALTLICEQLNLFDRIKTDEVNKEVLTNLTQLELDYDIRLVSGRKAFSKLRLASYSIFYYDYAGKKYEVNIERL